ncbi:MAG: hypothetical protein WKF83_11225 [Nocardioidaceae bacterium]
MLRHHCTMACGCRSVTELITARPCTRSSGPEPLWWVRLARLDMMSRRPSTSTLTPTGTMRSIEDMTSDTSSSMRGGRSASVRLRRSEDIVNRARNLAGTGHRLVRW